MGEEEWSWWWGGGLRGDDERISSLLRKALRRDGTKGSALTIDAPIPGSNPTLASRRQTLLVLGGLPPGMAGYTVPLRGTRGTTIKSIKPKKCNIRIPLKDTVDVFNRNILFYRKTSIR